MVARLVRDQEVVGSNPVASTNKNRRFSACFYFFEEAIRDSRGGKQAKLALVGGVYRRQNSGHPLFSVRVRTRRESRRLDQ